ncbi:MFS transporter, partial [Candidatus Bipolaricaulota bacterium]|nr:MFS transporter [Candidatus Bipolaricaulota bacterium]
RVLFRSLPILVTLDADRRVAAVVGVLYFAIYLVTCFASSRAGHVEQRLRSLPRAANATFAIGLGLLALAGAAAWGGIPGMAIASFLLLYAIQNLRRPLLVGYLADLLSHRTMATGLSVDTQLQTLLSAGIAPLLGFLADRWGVGAALVTLAAAAAAVFPFARVKAGKHGQ